LSFKLENQSPQLIFIDALMIIKKNELKPSNCGGKTKDFTVLDQSVVCPQLSRFAFEG